MRILALDVGTSAVKAAILEVPSGNPIGPVARASYDLAHPTPDAAEVPADRVWSAVADAARWAACGLDGIEAVGLSCLMPALPPPPEGQSDSWLGWLFPSFLKSSETVVLGPRPTAAQTRKAQQQQERLRKLQAEWKEQQVKIYDTWQRKSGDVVAEARA